jgi:hypothetical protein
MAPVPQGELLDPPCVTGVSTNDTLDPALESVAGDDFPTALRG